MDKIIEYIRQRYEPLSLIVYGSYADGSNKKNSDFDALVISKDHEVLTIETNHHVFIGGSKHEAQ